MLSYDKRAKRTKKREKARMCAEMSTGQGVFHADIMKLDFLFGYQMTMSRESQAHNSSGNKKALSGHLSFIQLEHFHFLGSSPFAFSRLLNA